MNAPISPERRDELIEVIAGRIAALQMTTPAVLLLQMHAPLAFFLSQILLGAQPFVGLVAGDRLARDVAFLFEEPENIERLIQRLEN